MDDERAARAALNGGVEASPLSRYAMTKLPRGGLMLGYAGLSKKHIQAGVRKLSRALS